MFEELLRRWDGEQVVTSYDRESDTWMLICIHSTKLGPATGGTRMKTYAEPEHALRDGLRLAAGMTRKLAVLGLPCGGGKAVLAVPSMPAGESRRRALERYGELIESLGGTFVTGPDVNTSAADMDVVGTRTPHVFCRTSEHGGSGDPSGHTALGVFHGIRASVRHALGSNDLAGRRILVQGAGSVGAKLVALLAEAGASVVVSDVDDERARATGQPTVAPDAVFETECDVYSPCALGATLSAETIPLLRCRVVAGAANNQLASEQDGDRLRARDILYAPDFVINGGGALHGIGLEQLGWDTDQVAREVERIGATLTRIYEQADAEGLSTAAAAELLAAEQLEGHAAASRVQ